MVVKLRDGDVPIAAPSQHNATYRLARLTGRCTIVRGIPIGTLAKEMSQTFGQDNPPLNDPNMNAVKAVRTNRGNLPTTL